MIQTLDSLEPPNTAPIATHVALRQSSTCSGQVGLPLHGVRVFGPFAGLEVGSGKMALSRPGRAPGWCPIPPTSTPEGAYPLQGATQTPAVRRLREKYCQHKI